MTREGSLCVLFSLAHEKGREFDVLFEESDERSRELKRRISQMSTLLIRRRGVSDACIARILFSIDLGVSIYEVRSTLFVLQGWSRPLELLQKIAICFMLKNYDKAFRFYCFPLIIVLFISPIFSVEMVIVLELNKKEDYRSELDVYQARDG